MTSQATPTLTLCNRRKIGFSPFRMGVATDDVSRHFFSVLIRRMCGHRLSTFADRVHQRSSADGSKKKKMVDNRELPDVSLSTPFWRIYPRAPLSIDFRFPSSISLLFVWVVAGVFQTVWLAASFERHFPHICLIFPSKKIFLAPLCLSFSSCSAIFFGQKTRRFFRRTADNKNTCLIPLLFFCSCSSSPFSGWNISIKNS